MMQKTAARQEWTKARITLVLSQQLTETKYCLTLLLNRPTLPRIWCNTIFLVLLLTILQISDRLQNYILKYRHPNIPKNSSPYTVGYVKNNKILPLTWDQKTYKLSPVCEEKLHQLGQTGHRLHSGFMNGMFLEIELITGF